MTAGEVLIPCPNCRSLVRYDSNIQIEGAYDSCLICGLPFPDPLRSAIETFLTDARGTSRERVKVQG